MNKFDLQLFGGGTGTKIRMGPCRVDYGEGEDKLTISKTIGGVEFSAEPILHEVNVDQYGQGAYDDIITGWNVSAIVRMAETDYEALKAVSVGMNEIAGNDKKKLVDAALGTSMRTRALKLVLHPLDMGDDISEDVTIYLAGPNAPLNLNFNYENERVLEVTMKGYPKDEEQGADPGDPNVYFCIGDETAVEDPSSDNDLLGSVYGDMVGTGPAYDGVENVLVGLKVYDFKGGLSVSEYAMAEILDAPGGQAVEDQTTTDVTGDMVIEVTAQDGMSEEYTIEMEV